MKFKLESFVSFLFVANSLPLMGSVEIKTVRGVRGTCGTGRCGDVAMVRSGEYDTIQQSASNRKNAVKTGTENRKFQTSLKQSKVPAVVNYDSTEKSKSQSLKYNIAPEPEIGQIPRFPDQKIVPQNRVEGKKSISLTNKYAESFSTDNGLKQAFLLEHNKLRRTEGVGLKDLTWDEELARLAAGNVKLCKMVHDSKGKTTRRFTGIGQNLWKSSGKNPVIRVLAEKAVALWMSEKQAYNYTNNKCSKVCGHYTQVVWKSTTSVGCAVSSGCTDTYVACNYGPPGNYFGQKPY